MPDAPANVIAEFEAVLDTYMEDWEGDMRERLSQEPVLECGGKGGKPGPCPEPGSAEQAAAADSIVKEPGLLARIARLPGKITSKAVSAGKGLYAKAEAKYGPKWAKAILATAIITLPTPFTMGSVAAMTGLAHVWTKFVSGGPQQAAEAEIELTPDEIKAAAAELLKALLAELEGGNV